LAAIVIAREQEEPLAGADEGKDADRRTYLDPEECGI
jgi:hypothetical protein